MRKHVMKNSLVVGIIILFTCSCFASNISGFLQEINKVDFEVKEVNEPQEKVVVTCNTYGTPVKSSREIEMSHSEAEKLFEKINKLAKEIAYNPSSDEIEKLKEYLILDAKKYNLLTKGFSLESLQPSSFLQLDTRNPKKGITPIVGNRGTASFCNFVTYGSGMQFPIIILPRLIPILLTPIPRAFLHWSANEGFTSCGSYLTGTGFMAEGMQRGTALGFWGIGFSVFIPPVMAYGFIGYALFATCTAEEIEPWPPNNPPVISDEKPTSEEWNIPITQSELSFRIEDPDGDKMSYSVTTDPDIGSGSGSNKKNGLYSVPISGLKSFKKYTWAIELSDGIDTTKKELSFITVDVPPDPFDPFVEGWKYRKQISINEERVAGNLNDFPILVSVTDPDLRDKAQSDGDDILFMLDSGISNVLYHEIEKYDSSIGELIAWVKIPSLSSSNVTTLFIYYGNPNVDNQQLPEKVWLSNYVMVQHMKDVTSSSIEDSTIFDNHGIKKASYEPIETIGKIGKAQNFDGLNDYIDTYDFDINDDFTISLWINPSSTTIDQNFIGKHKSSGKDENIVLFGYYDRQGTNGYATYIRKEAYREGVMTTGWQHMVYIGKKISPSVTKAAVYKNGVMLWQHDLNDVIGNALGKPWTIGQDWDDPGVRTDFFNGIIDEVRIINSIKSYDWVSTEYYNQNDPTSFMGFGPEETSP